LGITTQTVTWLKKHSKLLEGSDIVTLGRLYPYLSRQQERHFRKKYNIQSDFMNSFAARYFLDDLNCNSLKELDVSDYQGADIIHNLNCPVPVEHKQKFDVVLDAGTIEHVSDMKTFLTNIFDLLKINGVYIFGTVSNNWIDHGFWQFSPTFFIDLCEANDLELIDLNININGTNFCILNEPYLIKSILFQNGKRTMVNGIIKKGDMKALNLDFIQSKYQRLHKIDNHVNNGALIGIKNILKKLFNEFVHLKILPLTVRILIARIVLKTVKNNV